MSLLKAQRKASKKIKKRLSKFGIALLWGQIRSGKTRAFLDASKEYKTLVITKKDSQGGILSEAKEIGVEVDVINYHSVQKKNPDDYDLVVLDECFKGSTEILTPRGWVRFDELLEGEKVAQTDLKGNMNFTRPLRNIKKKYDGDMVTQTSQRGSGFSITATPNHRQPFSTPTMDKKRVFTFNNLPKTFKLPCALGTPNKIGTLSQNEKQLICYQADGTNHSGKRGLFTFSKKRKLKEFAAIFPNASEVKCSQGCSENVKPRKRFTAVVKNKSKKLADNFKLDEFSKEKAYAFIKEVVKWDGYIISEESWYYSCVDIENVNFVNAVAVIAGLHTYQSVQKDDRKATYSNVHRLFMTFRHDYNFQKTEKTIERFKGYVYCVEVPTSFIIVKQNGRVFISGNCHLYIASATPKFKPIWKEVVKFTRGKKTIFASGTPTPETYAGLYTMLALSTYTPFPYKRFTLFFADYGIPSVTYTADREVACYKKTHSEKIISKIKHLVVNITREETGHMYEAIDVYHHISMSKEQEKLLKSLNKKFMWREPKTKANKNDRLLILADTPVKMLGKSHQIAGGVSVKCEPKASVNPDWDGKDEDTQFMYAPRTFTFKKTPPKVKYIQDNFDPETTIILSYYRSEQALLAKLFPHTGSVVKLSTGVDLSHYKTMVVYSMGFSSANYEQVRGRLMNVKRKTQMTVHYLTSGIDEYVLEAVKAKENFTSRWYKKNH